MASVIISNVFDIAHSSYNLKNETKFTPKNSHITKYATATVPLLDQYGTSQMTAKGQPP